MTADAVGGVWTYALDLRAELERRGCEVHLATLGPPPRVVPLKTHVSRFRLEWDDDPWDDVDRAGAWLLELEQELEPDVVHLNGYVHGAIAWAAPVVLVAHSDVVSWWRAVHGCDPPPQWDRYRGAVEAGLRAADAVVAPTRAVAADLARHYSFGTPVTVVPNGRAPLVPRHERKERFVVGLGRFWDAAKNVAALERAAAHCPWPVVLAGEGTTLGKLPPREVAALLGRAAVFASPARYEPFGLAALEAALAGCALVLGDLPSLREVWGDAALFAPPDDDEAIVAALQLVIRDDELRRDLAERARRRAAAYSVERMAPGYLGIYGRVREVVAA